MAVRDVVMAAAGQGGGEAIYVDDVFSTYLYTGVTVGSTPLQVVNNGIDLQENGGLVWHKSRSAAQNHFLMDTATNRFMNSNTTNAGAVIDGVNTIFTTSATGYSTNIGTSSGQNYVSWTFRKAEKFFDVVTYTGNGVAGRQIAHSLGSSPGAIIIKNLSNTTNWYVWHRSASQGLCLNSTAGEGGVFGNLVTSTSATSFTVDLNAASNTTGNSYVAYLFAHDAGGFGESGNDNVISCGSFTTDGSGNATVNLGYEPQWLMIKSSSSSSNWWMRDVMRGLTVTESPSGPYNNALYANTFDADSATSYAVNPTATGFFINGWIPSTTYIYIAIRRPHKPPASGTSVFSANTLNTTNPTVISSGFAPDLVISKDGRATSSNNFVHDRLRGANSSTGQMVLVSNSTSAEVASSGRTDLTTISDGYRYQSNITSLIGWAFRRAPGFFDVVCYTGTGSTGNLQSHNLSVVPELIIFKNRSSTGNWSVTYDMTSTTYWVIELNNTGSGFGPNTYATTSQFLYAAPTATNISVGNVTAVNASGNNFVAYLFASLPGISKVGSYTGNGTSQTINCGFTAGARFFLVKATSTTGSWWVYDSARGIVAAADPALQLNSTAAEVTSADAVDPTATGIIVNQEATCSINASGVSYIFLAIA